LALLDDVLTPGQMRPSLETERGESSDHAICVTRSMRLPGVRLGRGAAGSGADGGARCQRVGSERDLEGAQRGAVELATGARADDRAGDAVLGEEPRQRHRCGFLTEISAQLLPSLQLRAELLDPLQRLWGLATSTVRLAEHAAEQPARQRAPRDD